MDERCPYCGSEDYGTVNEGHGWCCLTCGYDTDHGIGGVCPGGLHPRAGKKGLCCDACWKRVPTDLPGHPRWRSALRRLAKMRWRTQMLPIEEAVLAWLREHPSPREPVSG